MAYSAVISVQNTIERLLTSSHISIVASSREILEFTYKELKSLPETFKRLDGSSKSSSRKRMNALDEQIREAVCNLEDLLESHLSNQVISQSETIGDGIQLSIDLQELRQDVNSFVKTAKMKEEEYVKELGNPLPEEEEDDAAVSSTQLCGIKIVENCDGLPLMIVTVAGLLSKADKTPEYWNEVAEKRNSLFGDAYGEISEVLFPNYQYLPQHLKLCFLHMGVFPENFEIPRSKIFDFWVAEGFLKPNATQTLEQCANKYLKELDFNSLVVIHRKSSTSKSRDIKTCSLHSSLWHLCNREAGKNKFSHDFKYWADGFEEGVKGQRRLCFHNNILLGVEDVYSSVIYDCALTARLLLCFGSYHKYPVPICSELKLLRVLDALKIRLYEFPIQVLELLQLRYLALTCDETLPTSISKLWNLQFLIIHRHLSITSCDDPTYVPIKIWDMQELKHIQIVGSNLPISNGGASLKNLSTLLGVSAHSCSKGVLKRISNLKKLGIHIELVPDDDSMPFRCLNRIHRLHKLESLKCVLVNPELRSEVVALPAPRSVFPSSLQKLHLSGMGYPWEYMNIIGSLPNLHALKLRHYAFRGPAWEVGEFEFPMLRFLVIEDSDLVQWKVGSGSFSRLRNLNIKHCYELEEFNWGFDYFFIHVEVVDCNPLAAAFIHGIKLRKERTFRDVRVHSSWDDGT